MILRAGLVLLLGLSAACGTTRGRADVSAATANVPISMSLLLVDERGVIDPSRMEQRGSLFYQAPSCVNGSVDVSDPINKRVAELGGDAVTRFEIQALKGGGCVRVRVRGEVVKVTR